MLWCDACAMVQFMLYSGAYRAAVSTKFHCVLLCGLYCGAGCTVVSFVQPTPHSLVLIVALELWCPV